jgi:hypothetical protein
MFQNPGAVIAGAETPVFHARTLLLLDPRTHRLPPPPVLGVHTHAQKLDWYMHVFGALNEDACTVSQDAGTAGEERGQSGGGVG